MRLFVGLLLAYLFMLAPAFAASEWSSSYQYASDAVESTRTHYVEARHIEASVKRALQDRGIADELNVRLSTPTEAVIFKANTPLRVAIHGLRLQEQFSGWQAQAYILSPEKTLRVIPVSGQYERLTEIPVLKTFLAEGETIQRSDITLKKIPESEVRRSVIRQASALVGKTPRRGISAERPIRSNEIEAPELIKKGASITMLYTTPYLSIRSVGKALESGRANDIIRVENPQSEREVVARVTGNNTVEVNMAADMMVATNATTF